MAGRHNLRWATVCAVIALISAIGGVLRWYELGHGEEGMVAGVSESSTPEHERKGDSVDEASATDTEHADALARRFRQGVVMLHAGQYEHAALAFSRVLILAPRLPEAHVNMGFAMLGQGRAEAARNYFRAAIEARPGQRNAYYGLAEALEALGDPAGALGAMRTFVHLSPPDDPFVRKARAALWEWQAAGAGAEPRGQRSPDGSSP